MAASFTSLTSLIGLGKKKVAPTVTAGVTGTIILGGYVTNPERDRRLAGRSRYIVTDEIFVNTSIVASAVRYFLDLVAKPKWAAVPVDDSKEAQEAADFVTSCMGDMSTSWNRYVRKSAEYRFHGFGIQEWTMKKRPDGSNGIDSVEARPQHTIERWDIDEHGVINGVWQRSPNTGELIYLPRSKIIYMVDDTLNDSPEGLGLLRHLVEPAERLREYLRLEAVGFQSDLSGVPIGRAPLADLQNQVKNGKVTKENAEALKAPMLAFMENHIRNTQTAITLDSSVYRDNGPDQTPSATPLWGVDLLKGGSSSFDAVAAAINRLNHEMAVILGTENMLLGSGGQSGGSRALSTDKSEHLYLIVNSALADVSDSASRDWLGPLWKYNGRDDAMKPKLKVEDVQFKDVTEITDALASMAQAGAILEPDDPAVDDVRSILGISPAKPMSPEMQGELPKRPAPTKLVKGFSFGKFDPDESRDDHGRWSTGSRTRDEAEEWSKTAPSDIDDILDKSSRNQKSLSETSKEISNRLGLNFKDPGPKSRERLTDKINRGKSANTIKDAVRAGFSVSTPEQADDIVKSLSEKFEVADEGWTRTDQGYFDRKALVRFPDGQVGEIQIWPPGMLEAKEERVNGEDSGHDLYVKWQGLSEDDPKKSDIDKKMVGLYGKVHSKLPKEWRAHFDGPPPKMRRK